MFKRGAARRHVRSVSGHDEVIIEMQRGDVPAVMQAARTIRVWISSLLRCLFGIDHEAEGMDVVYELMSLEKGHTVTIKASCPADNLQVASVASVWNAADWHERETRDMFGIEFEGHPHLVPLLLPGGHDGPLPAAQGQLLAEIEEWQGELLGEDVGQAGHIPSGSRYEGLGGKGGADEE